MARTLDNYVAIGGKITLSDGNTYEAVEHPRKEKMAVHQNCTTCAFRPKRSDTHGSKLCREVFCQGSTDGKGKRVFRRVFK